MCLCAKKYNLLLASGGDALRCGWQGYRGLTYYVAAAFQRIYDFHLCRQLPRNRDRFWP